MFLITQKSPILIKVMSLFIHASSFHARLPAAVEKAKSDVNALKLFVSGKAQSAILTRFSRAISGPSGVL